MADEKLYEMTHLEAIRALSGMFEDNHEILISRLTLCNLIARNALGLAEDKFTDEQMLRVGIKLKRGTENEEKH